MGIYFIHAACVCVTMCLYAGLDYIDSARAVLNLFSHTVFLDLDTKCLVIHSTSEIYNQECSENFNMQFLVLLIHTS